MEARMAKIDKELADLLLKTATMVALSLNGWTSQNGLAILAMNIRWFGPKMERYKRCISFVKIDRSYSGENLATIVNITLIKYSIRQKLLSITADNASNNDTLCRHLLQMLSKHFNDHLTEFLIRSGTMRFKGEDS
jgi:hypothetical protein